MISDSDLQPPISRRYASVKPHASSLACFWVRVEPSKARRGRSGISGRSPESGSIESRVDDDRVCSVLGGGRSFFSYTKERGSSGLSSGMEAGVGGSLGNSSGTW